MVNISLLKPCYKINVLNHITYSLLQVVENNLNPRWKAFQIPVQQICNGDYDRTIQVSIFWSDNADFVNYVQYFVKSHIFFGHIIGYTQ